MRTPGGLRIMRRLGRLATDLAIVIMVIAAYSLAHNDEPDAPPVMAQTK